MKKFHNLRQKNWRKIAIHPVLSLYFFSCQKSLKHRRVSNKFLGTVTQQTIDGKTWCPLPSFIQFFGYQNFFELLKSSKWKFSEIWDKKSSTEKRDFSLASMKTLSLAESSWSNDEFLKNFFGNMRRKKSTEKRDIPLASIKWFRS